MGIDKEQRNQSAGPRVPHRLINPELPQHDHDLILSATVAELENVGRTRPDERSPATPVVLAAGAVGALWIICWHLRSRVSANGAHFLWFVVLTGSVVATACAVMGAVDRASGPARRRRLMDLRQHCVLREDLTEDAGRLLARADTAARAVLGSTVHLEELLDRQRNEGLLPAQEWELAVELREYSRLVRKAPKSPQGAEVVHLLAERRRKLLISRDGIERRVKALEAYASRVAEADRRYEELRQIQELTEGDSEVLDFLARTVRDDLAVAELEGITGGASIVVESLRNAITSARRAAVVALPDREAA